MWFSININVVQEIGFSRALILEHFFMSNPRINKAKLSVTVLAIQLPISLSTAQRNVKELSTKFGYLEKHSHNVYSLTQKFFDDFPEYITLAEKTIVL